MSPDLDTLRVEIFLPEADLVELEQEFPAELYLQDLEVRGLEDATSPQEDTLAAVEPSAQFTIPLPLVVRRIGPSVI